MTMPKKRPATARRRDRAGCFRLIDNPCFTPTRLEGVAIMTESPFKTTLPGNPRYQPKDLVEFFGYDWLYVGLADVELAGLQVLGEIDVIPPESIALLTPEVIQQVRGTITTTQVDKIEREVTQHDVRAWVRLAQEILAPLVGKWVHVPFTSYDPLDTGR